MTTAQLTLPQELVLLATDESSGKRLISAQTAKLALAGAILAELAIQGAVTVDRGTVLSTGLTPSACTSQAQRIAQARPTKAKNWVRKLTNSKSWQEACIELSELGILSQGQSTFFGSARFPALTPEPEQQLRSAIQNTLNGTAPTERIAAAISLLQASGLLRKLFPGTDRKRVKEIVEGQWASKAVKAAIDEINTAIISVVVMTTTAGSSN